MKYEYSELKDGSCFLMRLNIIVVMRGRFFFVKKMSNWAEIDFCCIIKRSPNSIEVQMGFEYKPA